MHRSLALLPLALLVACSSEEPTPTLADSPDTGTVVEDASTLDVQLPEDTVPADMGTLQDTTPEAATDSGVPADSSPMPDAVPADVVSADTPITDEARCTAHGPRLQWQSGKCFATTKSLACAWATATDSVTRCLPLPHAATIGWKGTTLPPICELPATLLGTADFIATQTEATVILADGRRWPVQVSSTARPAAGGTWVKYAPSACAVANEEFPFTGPSTTVLVRGAGIAEAQYVAQ